MPTHAIHRLSVALLVSLLLHAALLLWQYAIPTPKPPPRLEVKLPPPAPSTPPAILEESNTLDDAVAKPPPLQPPPPPPEKAPTKPTRLAQKQENTLLRKLSDYVVYPPEAIDAGHEGTVHLLLALKPDGTLKSASIAASSGHDELDRAALQAVGRLPRLDAGGKSEFIFPLTFRLQ